MKEIVIFGAGGHAHVIADIVAAEGNKVVAFLDDDLSQPDCNGPISDYKKYSDCQFVIGIGNADVREKLSQLQLSQLQQSQFGHLHLHLQQWQHLKHLQHFFLFFLELSS